MESKNELSEIHKIFKVIYSKAPPILKDLSNQSIDIDYKEFVHDLLDLKKINNKLNDDKYSSMTDVIKDIRIVLLNCYKFYGTKSDYTIKSLKFEELFENKISELDEHFKSLANVELTLNLLNIKRKPNYKFRYPKDCYNSELLKCVAHCRPDRLYDYHKILSNTYTTDVDNIYTLEELRSWEHEIFSNDHFRHISSMWELPEIGNFVSIIFKEYNYDIVNQSEIERMFLIPKESTTMSKIMTTLLMPFEKAKHVGQNMPYNVWSEKLSEKVSEWYKMYYTKGQNKVKIMDSLGIHPDFWAAVGDKNPLVKYDYCELSYFMKVWLVKGLCDYVFVKSNFIENIITNCNQRQCTIWKNNLETEEYFYFKSMPDLRIYYYNIPYDEPSLKFLELEETSEETKKNNALIISGTSNIFNSKSQMKPNEDNFKLIADSVQGLRSFLAEIEIDTSVPESLISALDNLIMNVEPNEYNLINLNNKSKIKLFVDWKSYPERMHKEKDEILLWKKQDSISSTNLASINEVISEKRKRKPILKEEFDNIYDSDEYFSSDFEKSATDYTDSDDEWGAINQSKNKNKRLKQHFKLVQLEKRLNKGKKIIKHFNDTKEKLPEIEKGNVSINGYKTNIIHDVEIIKIDDNKLRSFEIPRENNSKTTILNSSLKGIKTTNQLAKSNSVNEIISIEDDETTIISDDDDVQFIRIIPNVKRPSLNINTSYTNNSFNKLNTSVSVKTTSSIKHQVASTSISKKPNISLIPKNINLPKGIQVTMVNNSQTTLSSHFNSSKRSTPSFNHHLANNTSIVNVKCKVISRPNCNGVIEFYVSLPNGKFHPVSEEIMNVYLKEHNNRLPDYWLVPLPLEVAKKYGFI